MRPDETNLDDLLDVFLQEEPTTLDRPLESALVADLGELVEALQSTIRMLSKGDNLDNPTTRQQVHTQLARVREVLHHAERIVRPKTIGPPLEF